MSSELTNWYLCTKTYIRMKWTLLSVEHTIFIQNMLKNTCNIFSYRFCKGHVIYVCLALKSHHRAFPYQSYLAWGYFFVKGVTFIFHCISISGLPCLRLLLCQVCWVHFSLHFHIKLTLPEITSLSRVLGSFFAVFVIFDGMLERRMISVKKICIFPNIGVMK